MAVNRESGGRLKVASSGHLRRCSVAHTSNNSLSLLSPLKVASSGHLRRCSVAHTSNNSLSRDKDASREIDLVFERYWRPSQIASSGHLRRCTDADNVKKSLSRAKEASMLSWPTMMGHYMVDSIYKISFMIQDQAQLWQDEVDSYL
eukprot:scaffold7441_cov109-Skeletonema_dohrnii-CCMP3373.AAC.7